MFRASGGLGPDPFELWAGRFFLHRASGLFSGFLRPYKMSLGLLFLLQEHHHEQV